jgi:hypothetical protein
MGEGDVLAALGEEEGMTKKGSGDGGRCSKNVNVERVAHGIWKPDQKAQLACNMRKTKSHDKGIHGH